MIRGVTIIPLCILAAAGAVRADGDPEMPAVPMVVVDAANDARLLRTDLGADGPVNPPVSCGRPGNFPDLLSVTWGGWNLQWNGSTTPDPYRGQYTNSGSASLVRIDVVFNGLVCPPGPIDDAKFYNPYLFGNSPLYGSLDIDMDGRRDTGGELGGAAQSHYLALAGRFGELPLAPDLSRVPFSTAQLDSSFATAPQFERTGAEFSLTFCGCFTPEVVDTDDDYDGVFGPGDEWIVRGRFFRRAGGYQGASGAYGGSEPGLYDPLVNVRFRHCMNTETTTVSIVYPLTQQGAAKLRCWSCPVQPRNLDVSDDTSIDEAMHDVCEGAMDPLLPVNNPNTYTLANGWNTLASGAALDVRKWSFRGGFATVYSEPQPDASLVWTDLGFDERCGDYTGDGVVNAFDRAALTAFVWFTDGTGFDCDGMPGGRVTVCDFGPGFSAYDLNHDGVVDHLDAAMIPPVLLGDFNGDCAVNTPDLVFFLGRFGRPSGATVLTGDLNGDGAVDTFDLTRFLGRFGTKCN